MTWRNGTNRPWKAQFAALRVTPAQRLAAPPPRPRGLAPLRTGSRRHARAPSTTSSALPATASRKALVQLAHQRWAIEQQYQELKDELGTRSLRRTVVCRVASPRRPDRLGVRVAATRTSTRRRATADAAGRPSGDHGDPDGAFLRDATALLEDHAETRGNRSANLTK